MNVGKKRLMGQYQKMSQSVFEILDSDNFIHIKENATMWSSASELQQ